MNSLTHEEACSELGAVALDSVSAEVTAAVREHAAACPECGPELVALEETVAQLGQLLPQQAMNPGHAAGIRSRLLGRARTEREAISAVAGGRPDLSQGVASLTGLGQKLTPASQGAVDAEVKKSLPPKRTRYFSSGTGLFAFAASVALIAAAIQLSRVTSERNAIRAELAARADTVATATPADTSRSSVPNLASTRENQALIAAMAGPDVKIVPLVSKSATRMGRMFWNRASNDWTMVLYTMTPPRPGMTYQVWLVTNDKKISAGTFSPDSAGHAFMQAKYALDRNALKAVAVTEEPSGGMPSPTGPIVVSGSAAP